MICARDWRSRLPFPFSSCCSCSRSEEKKRIGKYTLRIAKESRIRLFFLIQKHENPSRFCRSHGLRRERIRFARDILRAQFRDFLDVGAGFLESLRRKIVFRSFLLPFFTKIRVFYEFFAGKTIVFVFPFEQEIAVIAKEGFAEGADFTKFLFHFFHGGFLRVRNGRG